MKRLSIIIRSWFVKHPGRKLGWSVEDFRIAKSWAKSQFDPNNRNRSLWDSIYTLRSESTEVLAEINKYIKC